MQKRSETAVREGRVDVLTGELFGYSRSQAARAIAEGRVCVNGRVCAKAGEVALAGALLCLHEVEATEAAIEKENIPIEILYQDEDIAVVVKPEGMVVHPAAGNESGTLVNALLYVMNDLSGIGGVKRPGIVHRLDKDTSGLLMIAKNDAAHAALSEQLKVRSMEKHYLAVVEGEMKQEKGTVNAPIARSKRDRKKMAVDAAGREALTNWSLQENLRGGALLDVHIITGRTHQIRVHMKSAGHPIAGDPLYGIKSGLKVPRLMLHAYSLQFVHPRNERVMSFVAPPPAPFTAAVRKWRKEAMAPLPYAEK